MKPTPLDMDDLVRRYAAGESLKSLAESAGVSVTTIFRRFQRAGIPMRRPGESSRGRSRLATPVDEAALVERYVAGESEKALSAAFGISRGAIRARLVKAGITPRGRSDSMYLRMAQAGPEERVRLAGAAHEAARLRVQTVAEKEARARTWEAIGAGGPNVSPAEKMLAGWLRDAGLAVIHQKAIGPYNVDIATGTVAVEILGGGWHHTKRHGERLRYILDAGWDVIYIWAHARSRPLTSGAAQYVISHLEFRNRNPALQRCYRVIRGGGELVAEGSADDDDIPDIIPFTDRPDVPPAEVPFGYCHCGCGRQVSGGRNRRTGAPVRYISGHNAAGRYRHAS